MPRQRSRQRVAVVFWNADSWLPDKYQEPYLVCDSIFQSLLDRQIYEPYLRAYGDAEKFTDDLISQYEEYVALGPFTRTKGSLLMLVDLLLKASAGNHRPSIVIAKLSQDSEMICRVLGSLKSRGFPVSFALPEVDVQYASFGITVCSEETQGRIPFWLCPTLFDNPKCSSKPNLQSESCFIEPGHSESYFIEPPAPEPHAIDFTMPADVDTCVFWDVEDYPLPPHSQLAKFCDNIRSAVPSSGGVWIYAYVAKDEDSPLNSEDDASGNGNKITDSPLNSEDDVSRNRNNKITVVRNAPADKFARLAKVIIDFVLWSTDNPYRSNLLLISKPSEDDMPSLYGALNVIKGRGHNVFFALPMTKSQVIFLSFRCCLGNAYLQL